MVETKGSDFKSIMGQLESILDLYLGKKAPQLPQGLREFLVKIAPYLAIVGVVIVTILAPFSFLGGLKGGLGYGSGLIFTLVTLVMLIMEAMAVPGLFKRTTKGWRLLYYAALVSGVQTLLSFNLGGLVIGTGISLYILFQVRGYYK
ncbi:chromate transporter [Candidatus Roizmanbacteria bacterium CG02_land_8_20_14_3_00_36_15]|uniref:Chromate transporter n=2 Tax=Candidatus Roizmaniibacteriota TaxID=1752723 RepID=A0A2M8KKG9_9BACT|nr:MAG: chromate transporter [Candidatus Roizmanbacteria bacterium CG03_land_8_20_14_0_80_36_21]PIV38070.1 MAG: chromate transporter [Candidatus Roizmanbacteria bacterium CG02_land_8_20_14_3_00_36_15]PIY70087.1 MAG: chromate transporter [Candidatus Roizmanbacteria bacterium CG_4_10_14_0_8_um_filter_36_36]PJA53811.1 MAG: chromate transporter [Candidatus Roizmanbacteria bacterium CG_4_9_14_3_um_filter_36_11]PJC82040.1 MAG: chromate transporter [Candidatus Roizmanbacteria bacterium CG_4_8_14_3_um_